MSQVINLSELLKFQQYGDPLADETIALVFKEHLLSDINKVLTDLLYATDAEGLKDAHPKFQEFLAATRQLPEWANQDRIIRGQELFNRFSPICLLSLVQASLPECYANSRIAAVLGETQKLEERAYKRIIETAQFLFYVMTPDGLEGEGIPDMGIRVIQRVRLIHGAIRHMVKNEKKIEQQDGDNAYFSIDWTKIEGEPISQLDLAYTLQTFSAVTLRSLRLVGLDISEQQADDFNHCWNVIGYVLGIDKALLFDSAEDSEKFFNLVKENYTASTEEGRQMAAAANHVLQQMLIDKMIILGWILSVTLPRPVLFRFLDDSTRELLGVRKANLVEKYFWFPMLVASGIAAKFLNRYLKMPLAGKLLEFLGFGIVKYFSAPPEYLGKASFVIPDHLQFKQK